LYICLFNKICIATDKLDIDGFQAHFNERQIIKSIEIVEFYRKNEPEIKSATLNWRIYSLVNSGLLQRIGRGLFAFGPGKIFIPEVSSKIKAINKKLKAKYSLLKICIWNTSVINEFMLHQPAKFFILVEVEEDAKEGVFYFLKENKFQAFLDPTIDIINRYALDNSDTVIVKSLTSEAPCQVVHEIVTITLEKLLVDVFCDDKIFAAQQGSELHYIFNTAFNKYTLNESRMLRYANRRRKKDSLNSFLNKVSKFRQ
jgi:hypothetical protein